MPDQPLIAATAPRLADSIPGGCHTYSKGSDQFPSNAPETIVRGRGARVLGSDGRWYIDCGMGLTSVSLGHGHGEVCDAVSAVIRDGVNFIRPAELEREAAMAFRETLGGPGTMVKFCKNGSVATTAAVKLARAFTGRQMIAVPADQPFFSYDDWFIGTTAADGGIPEEHRRLTKLFRYNDLESLARICDQHGEDLAGVMLEPVRFDRPAPGFLQGVRDLCSRTGAVLMFDETVTGLKWALRGGQEYFGVTPDLSVWGKGIANGFSACALSGRPEIMSLGGSNPEGRRVFLISTTHGAESSALAAMIATLRVFVRDNVIADNWRRGARLQEQLRGSIERHGMAGHLRIEGYPCYMLFAFSGLPEVTSLKWKTFLMQELVREGILSQGVIYTTPSHDDEIIDSVASAFDAALGRVAPIWARAGEPPLEGPAIKPVFRKFQECVKSRCGRIHADEPREPCCGPAVDG